MFQNIISYLHNISKRYHLFIKKKKKMRETEFKSLFEIKPGKPSSHVSDLSVAGNIGHAFIPHAMKAPLSACIFLRQLLYRISKDRVFSFFSPIVFMNLNSSFCVLLHSGKFLSDRKMSGEASVI